MQRVTLDFDRVDLSGYSDNVTTSVSLTPRQAGLIMFVLPLLLRRGAWDTMTDTAWDNQYTEISNAISVILEAV